MNEQRRYPTVCQKHASHCHDCMHCIAFDQAVKQQLSTYTLPPSAHPAVVRLQVQEWIGKAFPIPNKS